MIVGEYEFLNSYIVNFSFEELSIIYSEPIAIEICIKYETLIKHETETHKNFDFHEQKTAISQKKITIDGHGGHLCKAFTEKDSVFALSPQEAIGELILKNPELFNIAIDILPCETTAYLRHAKSLPKNIQSASF